MVIKSNLGVTCACLVISVQATHCKNLFPNLIKILTVFSLIGFLVSCGGGSGSGDVAPNTVTIQGIVSDDPVEGATVTIMSLTNMEILTTAITGNTGNYLTPPINENFLSDGYYITASGGISQGKLFDGEMLAVYGVNSNYGASHVTLLTTAVTKAAEANTTDLLQLHAVSTQIAETAISKGIYPEQWRDIDVAEAYSKDENAQIARQGVNNFTDQLGFLIDPRLFIPQPLGGTVCEYFSEGYMCSTHIGPGGGTLRDQSGINSGNVIVEIPSPDSDCEYIVRAKIVNKSQSIQSITVTREIADSGLLEVIGCKNAGYSGDMVIQFPPPEGNIYQAPDQNAAEVHPEMTMPQTAEASIEPGYFVTDGETHRVSNSVHRTASTGMVSIERKYGANLNRKTDVESKHLDAASVLFIHGFTVGPDDFNDKYKGESFGGGDTTFGLLPLSTWGQLPQLVSQLNITTDPAVHRFVPYNFQWRTDASFYDVAEDLAKAIRYAYEQSGNQKLHIVAHSFGGILARVTLQGRYDDAVGDDWSEMVATLTTVGTPHSGIRDKDVTVVDILLPEGWDSFVPVSLCKQISCYQAGGAWEIEDWVDVSSDIDVNTTRGGVIADLENSRSDLPDGLILQVLIGQTFKKYSEPDLEGRFFEDGDKLISFYGQRFKPESSADTPKTNLLYETSHGGAIVTERILGLKPKILDVGFPDKIPPDNLIDDTQLTDYANQNSQARNGYAHTAIPSNINGVLNLEVKIPSNCNDPDKCEHDTWVNIRDLLLAMHGGLPSPNFENTTGVPTDAVIVSSVACSTPIVGQTMTCTILGANLPELTQFEAGNCGPSPMTIVTGGSNTQRQFTCTPSTVGLPVEVNYAVPGFIGPLPLVPAVTVSSDPSLSGSTVTFTGSGVSYLPGGSGVFTATSYAEIDSGNQTTGGDRIWEDENGNQIVIEAYDINGSELTYSAYVHYPGIGTWVAESTVPVEGITISEEGVFTLADVSFTVGGLFPDGIPTTILLGNGTLKRPQSNPENPAGYLEFIEGNPGIEDDGVFISSSSDADDSITMSPYFTASTKPLVGVDGVTITVVTKLPTEDVYSQIFYEFGYQGTDCLVQIDDNDSIRPYKSNADATFYSFDNLSSLTAVVRGGSSTGGSKITNSTGCSEAEVSGMFFNGIEFLKFDLEEFIELDATILDSGFVNRFPNPSL